MTDSSSIDNDLMSPAPTAASVLGIKGPLRFRTHGSSQKAHVVLRRVDPESDSEGEGEIKGVIQFSLFAYKRIEVKPGKEILLTVADGPFKDRAIIFEGDELEGSSLSDVEEETQVAEDDDTLVPPEQSLPLKMRKPWAKRHEASVPVAHAPTLRAVYHSIGVQTEPMNVTESNLTTPTDPSPPPQQTISTTPVRGVSKSTPSSPIGISVSSSVSDVKPGLPPATKITTSKMGTTHPLHIEHNHSLSPVNVDTTSNNSLTPVDMRHPISPAPVKQDDVSTHTFTDARVYDKLERWSPSIPVLTALPATTRPADETSDSERSSSDSEDGNPPLPPPERPWSPSVPAALTTQASRRHNIRRRRVERPENSSSTRATQPSTEVPRPPSSPAPAPMIPQSLSKIKFPTKPESSTSVPGSFVPDVVGLPSSSSSDEDSSKTIIPPERISSSPSSVLRISRPHAVLPPPPHAEVPSSPSTLAHPSSPVLKKEYSPSYRSPASSRGSFSHGPLENNTASASSHPPSPKQPARKPQTFSWPPFRPGRDDGSTDFYPPFRAGPNSCEPLPPVSLRPTSGSGPIHDHVPHNAAVRGRPAMLPNSNTIPVAPRHSSFPFSSTPARPPSPPGQTFHHPQPFTPSMSTKVPLKMSQTMMPDSGGHPPRQPRSGLPMQPMAPVSLGQSMAPKAYPQYHRHQRHPHAPRSITDGRGHGIPMAAGTKRKASPPRMDPFVQLEIPPKRPQPSTWPTVSPIRCVAVQGEHVGIRGITFNRTGKLMAVTCADCTIRVWDNATYSEVARLPHSSVVVSAQWMDDDAGVLALCMDGALVRWTRPAGDAPPRAHDVWSWSRLLDPVVGAMPEEAPTALAYKGDRIAASFPKFGVRIWMMKQGSWQPQRPIDRQNVTAIEFIDDGAALVGGTKDGVLWYCQVTDPGLRMYNTFKARICGIDVLPTGTHALVSQQVGRTHLVAITQDENRGKIMQVYYVDPELQPEANYEANALFVGHHDAVLYGSARGYLFAWDKTSSRILCGLDHGEGCVVQAIGVYRKGGSNGESWVVTGSRDGRLSWWAEPVGSASAEEGHPLGKRVKTS